MPAPKPEASPRRLSANDRKSAASPNRGVRRRKAPAGARTPPSAPAPEAVNTQPPGAVLPRPNLALAGKPRISASYALRAARQRVLAQWRGRDLRPLEEERALRAKHIGALMPSVLASLRIDSRRAEAEVVKVWNNLLDPNIVAHAQPTGLRKGTLFVTVDNHTWHCEIVRYRYREILKQLQYSFGPQLIARISFRVG
jgi:hypothetical protein